MLKCKEPVRLRTAKESNEKKYFESTFGNLVRGHIEVSKQSKV